MKAYHYTTPQGWKKMNIGNIDADYPDLITGKFIPGEQIRGLQPNRRLVPLGLESALVPDEATSPHIFAMRELFPSSWLRNKQHPEIFDYLLRGILSKDSPRAKNIVILEVELTNEDNPLVVDYAKVIGKQSIDERYKNYWESRVPLKDYDGSYSLPEIIFKTPIPLERLKRVLKKKYTKFTKETGMIIRNK